MALGGAVGGSSARSRWGRAGEQGRAVGVGMTNRQYRGEAGADVSGGGVGESGMAWARGH
jgi:hypothetical protein